MGELANVIFAAAALVTAIGGAIGAVVTALRGGARERQQAAEGATAEMADTGPAAARIAALQAELDRIRKERQP